MVWTRNLSRGDRGGDVLAVKNALFALGYYDGGLDEPRSDSFGDNTDAAVRAFQRENTDANGRRLTVDGVVGKRTLAAIGEALAAITPVVLPDNIGPEAAGEIRAALENVNAVRRAFVLSALPFAFDAGAGMREYPISLYIRGGNLYDPSRRRIAITKRMIENGARAQPQYYDNGRMEMMLRAVDDNPAITGADCSGGIVGLLRKMELVKGSFDVTADMFASGRYSARISAASLRPGDFVGRTQHIGIYAGGGYVVEWMGGAYGCQLTKLSERRGWDFVEKIWVEQSAWTRFLRPKFFSR